MKISLIPLHGGLFGAWEDDEESIKRLTDGKLYTIDIKKVRNPNFHAKFFALLKIVVDNTDYINTEQVLILLKLKLGHYDKIINTNGKIVYAPKSISFSKMDDIEFEKFYNNCIKIILRDFLQHWESETIQKAIDQIVRF